MKIRKDLRLSRENRKCKNMWLFSLPAGKSCLNHKDCYSSCYARKAERVSPAAKASRAFNLSLAITNLPLLEEIICHQLKSGTYPVCRIHESGDFIGQKYLDMWVRIAQSHPNIKFFTFTKVKDRFDFSIADKLPNFNVINSYIMGKYLNFGTKPYVDELITSYPWIHLCPASAHEGDPKCNIDCSYCVEGGQYPIMYKH